MPTDISEQATAALQLDARLGVGRRERLRQPTEPASPSTPITLDASHFERLSEQEASANARVYRTLRMVSEGVQAYLPTAQAVMPASLSGRLLLPNGAPAAGLSVLVLPPAQEASNAGGAVPWTSPSAVTDARGAFRLKLPKVPLPESGLHLVVKGARQSIDLEVRAVDAVTGRLNNVVLDRRIEALPRSTVERLAELVPVDPTDVEDEPQDFASPPPQVSIGCCDDCATDFQSNSGVLDRFSYSMLFRLIEPSMSAKQLVLSYEQAIFPHYQATRPISFGQVTLPPIAKLVEDNPQARWVIQERAPITRPIDVTDFQTDMEDAPVDLPKAGTLAIGYVLDMNQTWLPAGFSLGNLVYSLGLAPGEEQRVAVREHRERFAVVDSETAELTEMDEMRSNEDSSTQAIFNSAFDETARGGSEMETFAKTFSQSDSGGSAFLLPIPGISSSGDSSSSGWSLSRGSASSWESQSRDYV